MNLILYFIIEYYIVILIILSFYALIYLNFERRMKKYVSLINKSIKNNEHLYTPEVRAFIQKTIQECGVAATVVPITGWRAGKKDESLAFGILPSTDKSFYMNIPVGWISFLQEMLLKVQSNTPLSAQETQKINGFIWIVHHEMNHVKNMIARRSVFVRSYPWKRMVLSMILNICIWIYIAQLGVFSGVSDHVTAGNYDEIFNFFILFTKALLIGGGVGFVIVWSYMAYRRCREEYVCDVQGIEDIAVLRGGIDWLMRDAKAYVDGLFDGPLRFLRFLYKAFPNALCSFFTLHPHPIARAAAIERKIAQFQRS